MAGHLSVPVEGGGFPHKVHLEVMWDFHRSSNAAPQFNSNFIPIVFKHTLLKKLFYSYSDAADFKEGNCDGSQCDAADILQQCKGYCQGL